jgi:hypothetical protein
MKKTTVFLTSTALFILSGGLFSGCIKFDSQPVPPVCNSDSTFINMVIRDVSTGLAIQGTTMFIIKRPFLYIVPPPPDTIGVVVADSLGNLHFDFLNDVTNNYTYTGQVVFADTGYVRPLYVPINEGCDNTQTILLKRNIWLEITIKNEKSIPVELNSLVSAVDSEVVGNGFVSPDFNIGHFSFSRENLPADSSRTLLIKGWPDADMSLTLRADNYQSVFSGEIRTDAAELSKHTFVIPK